MLTTMLKLIDRISIAIKNLDAHIGNNQWFELFLTTKDLHRKENISSQVNNIMFKVA